MKKYSEEHQWVEIGADGIATVGISQFAADELGEITFIELPEAGKAVKAKDQLCVIESVKAASDVYAPIGGTVCAVNDALEKTPENLNSAPEGEAWICKLENPQVADLEGLMDEAQYKEFIR